VSESGKSSGGEGEWADGEGTGKGEGRIGVGRSISLTDIYKENLKTFERKFKKE
jgi:hypothetical protein